MFEYDDGILVCKKHRTPAQKDDQGFWCRKCVDRIIEATAICEAATITQYGLTEAKP